MAAAIIPPLALTSIVRTPPPATADGQDFHFAFPASSQYTPNRLRWGRFFHPFHPDRLRGPRKGPALPPPDTEERESASFQAIPHTRLRPPSFLRPVCVR